MSFHWEMTLKVPIKQSPSFVLNASLSDYFISHIFSCNFLDAEKTKCVLYWLVRTVSFQVVGTEED